MNPIPDEIARTLCEQIRYENHHKWFSFARWQCWGCETFTQGLLTQMCLNSAPGNRGCNVLNDRYTEFLSEISLRSPSSLRTRRSGAAGLRHERR